VIAPINGEAIGGGLGLALACDIRIASTEAYFRAAGINNGLTASELGLSFTLPRAIGSSRAFEIMLTGRDVDAGEAARIGLVSETVARQSSPLLPSARAGTPSKAPSAAGSSASAAVMLKRPSRNSTSVVPATTVPWKWPGT